MNSLTKNQYWLLFAVVVVSLLLAKNKYQRISLPVYGQLSPFEMQDTSKKPFGTKELKGHVWIANFIFTSCPGPCSLMSKNMASLHRSFKLVNNIHLVSITVDPETDTAEVFKKYAQHYQADFKKWHFLKTSRLNTEKLLRDEFRVGFQDNTIFHSVYFVLVDDLLRIRGYYDGTDSKQLKKLFKDTAIQSKRSQKRQHRRQKQTKSSQDKHR